MRFQPQSGITTALSFFAYCYVPIPRLLCYSSAPFLHHMGSSTHLGIERLYPRISSLCMGLSSHLGLSRLHLIIYNSSLVCPCCYPQHIRCVLLTILSPHIIPHYFIQVFPKLCLRCLLTQPCVSPAFSHP